MCNKLRTQITGTPTVLPKTDTQDQSEDSFNEESAETTNSGLAETLVSLFEEKLSDSTAAPAVPSETCSLQPVTYDDTKYKLLI